MLNSLKRRMKKKMNSLFSKLTKFIDGDFRLEYSEKPSEPRKEITHKEKTIKERYIQWHDKNSLKYFRGLYAVLSSIVAVTVIGVLLLTFS